MKLTLNILYIFLFGLVCSCNNSTNEIMEELTETAQEPIDSLDCLDFQGVGAACGNFKVCPDHYLYSSTLLLRHINSKIEKGNKEIPETCCRRFDTLSFVKEIFLINICFGGTYNESWLYMRNKDNNFNSHYLGYYGIKLTTKTNDVNDLLVHEHHSDIGAMMIFNGQGFDTLNVVSCKELNDTAWECWNK